MKTLKTLRRAVFAALLLSAPMGGARGYENDPTHRSISTWSVQLAAVAGYEELRAFGDQIAQGSVDEDEMPRFANHFWDPDAEGANGLPQNSYTCAYMKLPPSWIGTRFMDALTWAREGMPDDLDWYGAVDAYGYSDQARERAYLALGHAVHLLQDMAQPDHAQNRPHPGGHTHEVIASHTGERYGEAFGEFVVPSDRVAYETLWVYNDQKWPRGKLARKFESLEAAFKDLATKSKKAEKFAGLLRSEQGELALGLGALKIENPLLRGIVAADRVSRRFLHLPSLKGALDTLQLHKFQDRLWAHFESNIPLMPLIPWPAQQETYDYLDLGNMMIPLAEEHGAGLMQLFHDIVNHPPIVQGVLILQDDKEMYHKEWKDGPEGRTLETVVDTPLKQGANARIRITFGPSRVRAELKEPVTNVLVALETGASRGPPLPGRYVGGSSEPVTWESDEFKVEKAGTLCITANDTQAHFEGREHKGDVLDSNPASYALAKSPAPFHWVGYEPGEDRNHQLRLVGGCGVCAAAAQLADTFVSGTLQGKVTMHVENSEGLYVDVKLDVTYRCLRVGYAWDRAHQQSDIIFGAPTGSYEYHWRAYTGHEMQNHSGTNLRGGGGMSMYDQACEGGHPFVLSVDTPDEDVQTGWCTWGVESKATEGLSLSGRLTYFEGNHPHGDTTKTWNLTFKPTEAPAHVTAADIMNPARLGECLGEAQRQIWEAMMPAWTALHTAGRRSDAERLGERLTGVSEEFSGAVDEWSSASSAVPDAYIEAEKAWIYTDRSANTDAQYEAAVQKLTAAVARWKRIKKGWEEKYAAVAESIARDIEPVNKDAATKVADLARKLTVQGCESFAGMK